MFQPREQMNLTMSTCVRTLTTLASVNGLQWSQVLEGWGVAEQTHAIRSSRRLQGKTRIRVLFRFVLPDSIRVT